MELQDLLTLGGASIIVVIIVEVIKRTANMGADAIARFGPLLAVIVGIATTTLASIAIPGSNIGEAVLTGLLAGSSAAGIYSFTKSPNPSAP